MRTASVWQAACCWWGSVADAQFGSWCDTARTRYTTVTRCIGSAAGGSGERLDGASFTSGLVSAPMPGRQEAVGRSGGSREGEVVGVRLVRVGGADDVVARSVLLHGHSRANEAGQGDRSPSPLNTAFHRTTRHVPRTVTVAFGAIAIGGLSFTAPVFVR